MGSMLKALATILLACALWFGSAHAAGPPSPVDSPVWKLAEDITGLKSAPLPTPAPPKPPDTPKPPAEPEHPSEAVSQAPAAVTGMVGSYGFVIPGNNCVVCVRFLTGWGQNGNAGTWITNHSNPQIGDVMILRPGEQGAGWQGHVMKVVGINGRNIYVAHCNYAGRTVFYDNGNYWRPL